MLSFTKLAIVCIFFCLSVFQVALAQDASIESFPECSIGCLGKADPGSCGMQDNACLCANPTFVQGTFDCFKSACPNAADLKQAWDFSSSLCKQAGVSSTVVAPPKRTAIPEPIQRRGYPPAIKRNSASVSVSVQRVVYLVSGGTSVLVILSSYF
ncbi:hypothetical protein BDV93DRAFT_526608 [Ceratobasidium sp. AG-I]|nr:hypothetical protein BDV93DRAFT_526608 [Ceratobasidium sp. AG-I]